MSEDAGYPLPNLKMAASSSLSGRLTPPPRRCANKTSCLPGAGIPVPLVMMSGLDYISRHGALPIVCALEPQNWSYARPLPPQIGQGFEIAATVWRRIFPAWRLTATWP